VKRVDLIHHLEQYGCQLLREGGSHSVYVINNLLARKICRDLEIPKI
jgi:predicted RNA binding protein YcfA (HicA-like mRNA interferase family)